MQHEKLDYRQLIEPALELFRRTDNYTYIDEVSEALIDSLGMPASELQQLLPSGRQTVFDSQLQWALSYLEQDRLIESDGANAYRITAAGRQVSAQNDDHQERDRAPAPESMFLHQTFSGITSGMAEESTAIQGGSPHEVMSVAFENIYRTLKHDVLERIYGQSPAFFENLIIDLLLSMGYGDRRRDLVAHLGQSGDGGVDGAIKQDQLGLDVVYVQAKRYRPGLAVPVSAIRDFAGALEAHKANKGLFVTTSHFTKSGRAFIAAVSSRIVLIDGEKLSSLLIRNNVGVQVQETYEIKKIDEEYFNNA